MDDYSDREWLWQARQSDRISPAFAQEVHEKMSALESQLAQLTAEREVLVNVEEIVRSIDDNWQVTIERAGQNIIAAVELDNGEVCATHAIAPTVSAALAALVAAVGKENS